VVQTPQGGTHADRHHVTAISVQSGIVREFLSIKRPANRNPAVYVRPAPINGHYFNQKQSE
jgi:hypothetical protein